MNKLFKLTLGTIGGIIFLWAMFWVYMIIIETGTVIMVFAFPFILFFLPLLFLIKKVFLKKDVSTGEWIFSFAFPFLIVFIFWQEFLDIFR